MSITVFLLVLLAALMHASWNALVKLGTDRFRGMLLLTIPQGLVGLVIVLLYPLPSGQTWVWLLFSGLFHSGYKVFLAAAYEKGDLSRVYPIARGAAPMMVAAISILFLAENVAVAGYLGILLIGFGIMLLARGIWSGGEALMLLPLALASAACTAGYSLVDGLGARVSGNATLFTGWLFVLDTVFFTVFLAFKRGPRVLMASPRDWARGTLAGVLSFFAYWIAVWAMTVAPIPLVTALRETSVLFATLIGIIWLKEPADRSKFMASVLIIGGIVFMRL